MQFIPPLVFIPILGAIGYYDLKRNIIPNKIVYPGVILAIILNIIFSDINWQYIVAGGTIALIGGFVLSRVAGIGGGDIKFLALIGLMFGYPWFLAVLLGGFLLGGMMVLVFHLAKRLKKNEGPLGFYMAVSGIVVSGWLIFVIFHG